MSQALKKVVTCAFSLLLSNSTSAQAGKIDDEKFQAAMQKIIYFSDLEPISSEGEPEDNSFKTSKKNIKQDFNESSNEPDAIQYQVAPQEKKVRRGDRIDIEEAPTTSLHWFKMADKKHNHEEVVQYRDGKVIYTHTQLAACHFNAACVLLEEDYSPELLKPLKGIMDLFAEARYLPPNFQRFTSFHYDISPEELKSNLYKLSPAVYHLMKSTDHLYAKRRLSLVKQRVSHLPRSEREDMLNSIDIDYLLSCEIWKFLKNNLSDEHYSSYRRKQAELSAKFLMPFRSDAIQIRVL